MFTQPTILNLEVLKPGRQSIIISENNPEKFSLIKYLIYHYIFDYKYNSCFVCCNLNNYSYYKNIIDEKYISTDTPKMLNELLKNQLNILSNIENKNSNQDYRTLLILDVIDDSSIIENIDFKDLIYNGIHYGITTILSTSIKNIDLLNNGIIGNCSFIFLFNNINENEIKKMYNLFGGIFLTEKDFKTALQTFTQNNQIFILNLLYHCTYSSLNDHVNILKIEDHLKKISFNIN